MKIELGVSGSRLGADTHQGGSDEVVDIREPHAEGRQHHRGYLPSRQAVLRRFLDVAIVSLGLVVAAPLFGLIALAIKLDSAGPVFFRQERVGLHRRRFLMLKFRKMPVDLPRQGPMLTTRHDPRLTRVGRILERTKLDELPQLINVLLGEMSVVGPRPEVPKFIVHYPHLWDMVLSVKPGLFGPNQLSHRNESELYPSGVDIEDYYVRHILPRKLQVDATYAQRASVLRDLVYLAKGVVASILGSVTAESLRGYRLRALNLAVLSTAGVASMAVARAVVGGEAPAPIGMIGLVLVARPVGLLSFRVSATLSHSVTVHDFRQLLWAALSGSGLIVSGLALAGMREIPWALIMMDLLLFFLFLVVYKLVAHRLQGGTRNRGLRGLSSRGDVWVAPASGLFAAGVGVASSTEHLGAYALLAAVVTAVRPLTLLLSRPIRPGASVFATVKREFWHLALVTVVGWWITMAILDHLLSEQILAAVLLLEAVLFFIGMLALTAARARRSGVEIPSGRRPSTLLVGDAAEVSGYLAGLEGSVAGRGNVVGILTDRAEQRSSFIGGYRILGDLSDVPRLLDTVDIDRILIVGSVAARADARGIEVAAEERDVEFRRLGFHSEARQHPPRDADERAGSVLVRQEGS